MRRRRKETRRRRTRRGRGKRKRWDRRGVRKEDEQKVCVCVNCTYKCGGGERGEEEGAIGEERNGNEEQEKKE